MSDSSNDFISSRQAALCLGVVERTVGLLIARNELRARREGRRWLIERASVEAHPRARSATPAMLGAGVLRAEPEVPVRARSYRAIQALVALADLAVQVLRATEDSSIAADVIRVLRAAALDAAGLGAAGFHAYVPTDKARLYGAAREKVAVTAATLWIAADLAAERAEGLRELARAYESVAPSLGALLKSAGKRRD